MLVYIMPALLMLFAALFNAVCLHNAYLQPLIFAKKQHIVCLFEILFCIIHSAFYLLVFPNSMFTLLL